MDNQYFYEGVETKFLPTSTEPLRKQTDIDSGERCKTPTGEKIEADLCYYELQFLFKDLLYRQNFYSLPYILTYKKKKNKHIRIIAKKYRSNIRDIRE